MIQTNPPHKCDIKNVDCENLIKDYQEDIIPISELKIKYKVSDKILYKILKKYDVVRRDDLPDSDKQLFSIDYQDGILTSEELSKKYNKSMYQLNRIAKKLNIFKNRSEKTFSEKLKDQVCADYVSTMSMGEIYEKYNLSQYVVNNFIDERGIRFDKAQQMRDNSLLILSEETKDAMCAEYMQKIPINDIVKKYDTTHTAFQKVIDERGISYGRLDRIEEKRDKILDLYKSGISTTKMAEMLHMSQNDIARYVENAGIELRKTDFYLRKYEVNHNYFEIIDTHEKAQILGLIMTDGYVESNKHTVNIGLQEDDKYYLEWVNRCMDSTYPIHLSTKAKENHTSKSGYTYNIKNHYKFTVCSPKMQEDLVKLGIVHRKTYVNSDVPNIPENLMSSYLLGALNGDGTVGIYQRRRKYVRANGNITYTTVTDTIASVLLQEKHAQYFYNLLNKLGITTTLTHKKHTKNNLQCINIQERESLIRLYHYLYSNADFTMVRKHDKFVQILEYLKSIGYYVGEIKTFNK